MADTLFGIPLVYWGIGCLGIGIAYWSFWPRPNPKRLLPRSKWHHLVLRYGHTAVWVLLAAGCFAAAAGKGDLGRWIALMAIPVYLIFMWIFVRDRGEEINQLASARRDAAGKPTNEPSA